MQHTERLLKIVNLLRNRRTVLTARDLSEQLDVSIRTIYRDMQKLEGAGIPIEGEAGVGYRIMRHFDMPPLMFDADEVEALILGVRMVRAWSDQALAANADSALNKIIGVLPPDLKDLERSMVIEVPRFADLERHNPHAPLLRDAVRQQHALRIEYLSLDEQSSERVVWPLGIFFWGQVWTVVAHCCLREGYRSFRVDRIQACEPTGEHFSLTETCSLAHYLSGVKCRSDYAASASSSVSRPRTSN